MRLITASLMVLIALVSACADDADVPGATATPTAVGTATTAPTQSPSPTFTPVALPTVVLLSAPSRDVVWAQVAGQLLFVSTDRGETWEPRSFPQQRFGAIAFADEQFGWWASLPTPRCADEPLRLFRTIDGSQRWQPLDVNDIADERCRAISLAFLDAARGYLVASGNNLPTVVYRTQDSGTTWTASAPLPEVPGFDPSSGPPPAGLAFGAMKAFGGELLLQTFQSDDKHVFGSSDGGATWRSVAAGPYNFVPRIDGPGRAESFVQGEIGLATATRWIFLGPPGQSRETTDAGASWHPFATDYSQAASVPPFVVFADAEVGYATVRGSIQRTLDGGAHWEVIETPGTVR